MAKKLGFRVALLLATGVSLYLLLPSLLEVLSSWPQLFELDPLWLLALVGLQGASYLCLWELQLLSLRCDDHFAVATSQLAGGAFGRVVPGGMAASAGLQSGMLVRAGIPAATVGSGLTLSSVLTFAALLALPVLAIPAILAGAPVSKSLWQTALLGGVVFALTFAAGAVLMFSNRALVLVARSAQWVVDRVRRGRGTRRNLLRLFRRERALVRTTLGRGWPAALAFTVGRWAFDFATLLVALWATGAEPRPSLVLLAYVAAQFLGMIPLTPGGLGFVEAGLTGALVLAGVPASAAAFATLTYRLVQFWLPLPAGLVSWLLFRRRYPGP